MKEQILKTVKTLGSATNVLSSSMGEISIGFTEYGYTPMKIGTMLDFAVGRAYDFYLDGYCDPGGNCTDIISLDRQSFLCLVQVPEGIMAKYFFSSAKLPKEAMYETTKDIGVMLLNNLEIALYRNKIHRLNVTNEERRKNNAQLLWKEF